MKLSSIERVHSITKQEFVKHYVKPQKPVVKETLTKDWDAYKKWNLAYIKEVAGTK